MGRLWYLPGMPEWMAQLGFVIALFIAIVSVFLIGLDRRSQRRQDEQQDGSDEGRET